MINVNVEYTAQLRVRAGCASDQIALEQGTVTALFAAIAKRRGTALKELLIAADGGPAATILCFINDQQIDWQQPPTLRDGDRITLMSPISGG